MKRDPPQPNRLDANALRDRIRCPACDSVLSDPHSLRCGHTVCLSHLSRSSHCPVLSCHLGSPPNVNVPSSSSRVAYFPAQPPDGTSWESIATEPSSGVDITARKVVGLVCTILDEDADDTGEDSDTDSDDVDESDTVPLGGPDGTDGSRQYTHRRTRRHSLERPHRPARQKKRWKAPTQPVSEPESDQDEEDDLLTQLKKQSIFQQSIRPDMPLIPQNKLDIGRPSSPQSENLDRRAALEKELLTELTCEICLMLLHEPLTSPCQHTFCTKCLHRSLDHSPTCPLCRQELPGFAFFQDAPTNQFLYGIIKTCFMEIYEARGEAIATEEKDKRLDTPIFVCQLSFPEMPTVLHFFEPRYRLMLRRCLQTDNPSFGMIMPPAATTGDSGASFVDSEYGTMLEIRSVQMLPDGRSMVETWGTYRFRILERGILDGYTVGRIERIEDLGELDDPAQNDQISLTAGDSPAEKELSEILRKEIGSSVSESSSARRRRLSLAKSTAPPTEVLVEICQNFFSRLRAGTAPWVVQRLNNTFGPMPSPDDDLAGFSFWVGMIIPIDEREKAKLLPIRSSRLRLRLCVHWIEQLDGNWLVNMFLLSSRLLWAPAWCVASVVQNSRQLIGWIFLCMGVTMGYTLFG